MGTPFPYALNQSATGTSPVTGLTKVDLERRFDRNLSFLSSMLSDLAGFSDFLDVDDRNFAFLSSILCDLGFFSDLLVRDDLDFFGDAVTAPSLLPPPLLNNDDDDDSAVDSPASVVVLVFRPDDRSNFSFLLSTDRVLDGLRGDDEANVADFLMIADLLLSLGCFELRIRSFLSSFDLDLDLRSCFTASLDKISIAAIIESLDVDKLGRLRILVADVDVTFDPVDSILRLLVDVCAESSPIDSSPPPDPIERKL